MLHSIEYYIHKERDATYFIPIISLNYYYLTLPQTQNIIPLNLLIVKINIPCIINWTKAQYSYDMFKRVE